ncbi:MAG: hypothetical protein ACP5QA_13820 [Phycisphaerae bacterium]
MKNSSKRMIERQRCNDLVASPARFVRSAIAAAALAASLFASGCATQRFAAGPNLTLDVSAAEANDLRAIAPEVNAADAQDDVAAQKAIAMVGSYFTNAQHDGARKFADDISGIDAQANFIEDHMRWSDGKNFSNLMEYDFKRDVLSTTGLRSELGVAAAYYLQQRQANFNKLVIAVTADLGA